MKNAEGALKNRRTQAQPGMRILFIMRSSLQKQIGGAELQADYICRVCEENGCEVHYAFDSNENLDIVNRKVSYHLLRDYGWRSLCWLNCFAIGNLIRRIKPDIIYQCCRFAYTGTAAYYAKKYAIPMIYNVASDSDCLQNRIPINRGYVLNAVNEYAGRYGIRNAHTIIAQTRRQQRLLKENFNRDSILLPAIASVPPLPLKKSTPPVVLWIANLKRWKQPDIFLQLAEACHHLNARFVFAGRPGRRNYHAMLVEKAKQLPNTEYLGEIPFKETNEWFSRSLIFVNTSLPDEGYPNTYVQAWLHEVPVVALHCDPDDVLKDRNIGFHSGEFSNLVRDVRYLCENETVARETGRRARKHAIKTHAIETAGPKYVELFRQVLVKGVCLILLLALYRPEGLI